MKKKDLENKKLNQGFITYKDSDVYIKFYKKSEACKKGITKLYIAIENYQEKIEAYSKAKLDKESVLYKVRIPCQEVVIEFYKRIGDDQEIDCYQEMNNL